MPSILLHPPSRTPTTNYATSNTSQDEGTSENTASSPSTVPPSALPQLLQTPSGLALVEIQGTIHAPGLSSDHDPTQSSTTDPSDAATTDVSAQTSIEVGRIIFPDYDAVKAEQGDKKWMKRVYLYIGKHQRMTGEVRELRNATGVIRRRKERRPESNGQGQEELEIAEIVRHKIVFASRPEPVGTEEVVA